MCIHYTISDSLYISFNILPFVSYIFNIHYLSGSFFLSLSTSMSFSVCVTVSLFFSAYFLLSILSFFFISLYISPSYSSLPLSSFVCVLSIVSFPYFPFQFFCLLLFFLHFLRLYHTVSHNEV